MRRATLSLDPDEVEGFGGIDATDDHHHGDHGTHHGEGHMPEALNGIGPINSGGLDQVLGNIGKTGIGDEGDEGCRQPYIGEGN